MEATYKNSQIRSVLRANFNDIELVSLCQDEFPELCDLFGSGMGKEHVINCIMGHFIQGQNFGPLVDAIKGTHPDAFAQFDSDPNESGNTASQNAYDNALASNFDLENLVDDCLDALWLNQGLVGFGVPCNLPVFLTNFCQRVQRVWGRSNVILKPILVINPINTSVDRAVLTVNNRYRPALKNGNVLLPVQVNEQAMGDLFWRKLCESFQEDGNCANRFIVVVGMHEECDYPEEIVKLGHPRFRNAHIISWVNRIVRAMNWPDDFGQYWSEKMIGECTCDGQLIIEWVYEHLEAMLEILKQNPLLDHFKQELDKRSQLYE